MLCLSVYGTEPKKIVGFLFKSDHTGGDVKRLGALDGIDTWHSLVVGKPSPRSEILHNIDQNAGIAALRYRDFKLVVGSDGEMDARFEVPGGSRPYGDLDALLKQSKAAAVLRRFYGKKDVFKHVDRWRLQATIKCGHDHDANFRMGGSYYLFDIVDDPCEQRNLAKERPDVSVPCRRWISSYGRAFHFKKFKFYTIPKCKYSVNKTFQNYTSVLVRQKGYCTLAGKESERQWKCKSIWSTP